LLCGSVLRTAPVDSNRLKLRSFWAVSPVACPLRYFPSPCPEHVSRLSRE
jgi:hypothetical protein